MTPQSSEALVRELMAMHDAAAKLLALSAADADALPERVNRAFDARLTLKARLMELLSGEPVARILHWHGPAHQPVPHGGICARTFAEFPHGYGEGPKGYWHEGEPLYTAPPQEERDAPAAQEVQMPEPAWWGEEHGNKHGRRGIYREQQRRHSHQSEFFGLFTAAQLRAYGDARAAACAPQDTGALQRAAYAEARKDEREALEALGILTDCRSCNGSGEREVRVGNGGPDDHAEIAPCPECGGTGDAPPQAEAQEILRESLQRLPQQLWNVASILPNTADCETPEARLRLIALDLAKRLGQRWDGWQFVCAGAPASPQSQQESPHG